jgi:hypothetical protein
MLRFLHQIRQRVLTEKRFGKYLLYIFIEVLIVIIGILIAIEVDTRNEERRGAENTKTLFKEVSDELVFNIKSIDKVIDTYLLKDSLYFKVLNHLVAYEDYKASPLLFHFPLSYDRTNLSRPLMPGSASLVDDDFNELLARKNNLTEKQDSLFSELKDLYGKRKISTDVDDKNTLDAILKVRETRMRQLPWWSNYNSQVVITDEMIQHALTDPFYLNELSELQLREYWHATGMLWFRTKALNLYIDIADMLKIEKDTSLVKDLNDFEHVKGFYRWEAGNVGFDIREEDELKSSLFINEVMVSESSVYPYSNSHLIIYGQGKGDNYLAKIEIGKDGEVLGLSWFGNMREENKKKIISRKTE